MKQFSILLLFLLSASQLYAQYSLQGTVVDDKSTPLPLATITLLEPADSTMAHYSISNADGHFEIKGIKAGRYIFQAALLGYKVAQKSVEIPFDKDDLGVVVMKENAVTLKEAEIASERVPILIKKDTIEYNAGSYKTAPDAAAEDLLKKLPGVEVDREGNIKAQGENVKKVLVDGKEFFSSDPKVATKNLPADAIDKVQVYDKKSDETEFTGIEDGTRDKTINLLLKDNKKSAWMGDVQAGGGTDEHYETSAKAYRFTKKTQFAALGMMNNINQFGFSFRDYIDFNGGINSLMGEDGGIRLNDGGENGFPIDFGRPVTGLITSGAGGLNYSYERKKGNRFNMSYLGNGADKFETNRIYTQNFSNNGDFISDESQINNSENLAHRLNLGWRNKPDSSQQIIFSGNSALSNSKGRGVERSDTYLNTLRQNNSFKTSSSVKDALSGDAKLNYLKKGNGKWKVFKAGASFSGSGDMKSNEWKNTFGYAGTGVVMSDTRFRKDEVQVMKYSLTVSGTRDLAPYWYFSPEVKAGSGTETLDRKQGMPPGEEAVIDSLSPGMSSRYQWARAALGIRKNKDKMHFGFSARAEGGKLSAKFNDTMSRVQDIVYFLPTMTWRNEYKKNHHLEFFYNAHLTAPSTSQLMPVSDNTNPLQVFSGNMGLRPEYSHDFNLNWILFDPFSFMSLFTGINGSYTHDKINWERTVDSAFRQTMHLINVSDDYRAAARAEFSTPIRKLKLSLSLEGIESYNRGINYVNGIQNINTNYTHELRLSFDNRKKEKWDGRAGAAVRCTNSFYSLEKSLNANYFDMNYFADLTLTPNTHWNFTLSADVMQYDAKGFRNSVSVPLLRAGLTRYFLKSNRAAITLKGFDLLNKNTGLSRTSELNYLEERRSNIIGRYVMLTFKYRLNKFDSNGGVNIKVNGK